MFVDRANENECGKRLRETKMSNRVFTFAIENSSNFPTNSFIVYGFFLLQT